MNYLIQGLVFFLIFGSIWHLAQVKNVCGLGAKGRSKKETLLSSLLTALLATIIFVVLLYLSSR